MPAKERRLAIAHGEPRKLPLQARRSRAAVDLSEQVEVTLVIRSRGSEDAWQKLVSERTSGLPGDRRYLSHAELARRWAASPEDIAAVRKAAMKHRLKVVSSDAFRRCVVVSGTLSQLSRAFEVEFHAVDHPLGTFRSHHQAPRVDESIHPLVECILGLDDLPTAAPHAAPAPASHTMDRRALLNAYEIPTRLRGKGQCVAVITLGGGVHKSDLRAYFKQFGLTPPRLRMRGIRGVKNDPAPAAAIRDFVEGRTKQPTASVMWTLEATTDVSMVGTIAPEVSILFVLTSNTDQGQYHAITSVIADARNAPSVLSCSWGGPESTQSPSYMRAVDRWFQAAAVLGMTICVSSGDRGDGASYAKKGSPPSLIAQFPATSPHVLTCGGTTLDPKAGTEVAWIQPMGAYRIASGGGFSEFFPFPEWQRAAGIDAAKWIPSGTECGKGRAIPDVAAKANMDEKGYSIIVGGVEFPAGGTSAAAPLWGALVAILNQGLKKRVGSLHAALYSGVLSTALRDIVRGNTGGAFAACEGWDACTGWGSPRGEAMLRVLRDRPLA